MRIVVIGGTSEIAQECCELWLTEGLEELVLTGRDATKLSRIVRDFEVRHPKTPVVTYVFDHLDVGAIKSFVEASTKKPTDLILIAHGSLTSQPRAAAEVEYLWHELQVNACSPITFLGLFANVLQKQGFGQLAIIGSVAGDRGRAINYSYGAAKAALATCVSGLQHRFARTQVKISVIKPGPTRTAMTRNVHLGPSKLAEPKVVARQITKGLAKGHRVIYTPRKWGFIMLVVRIAPFSIFKYLRF
jgi:decaprenylphospho-beta-D-erythro-pentofuranosid-2-ulose 2-reductase